jgi:hypothetical protein
MSKVKEPDDASNLVDCVVGTSVMVDRSIDKGSDTGSNKQINVSVCEAMFAENEVYNN